MHLWYREEAAQQFEMHPYKIKIIL